MSAWIYQYSLIIIFGLEYSPTVGKVLRSRGVNSELFHVLPTPAKLKQSDHINGRAWFIFLGSISIHLGGGDQEY